MRIYPDLPLARARAIALDALTLLLLWLCLTIGLAVHDAVGQLDVLGRGVERAGGQVQAGFQDAGDKVNGAPVVGDRLDDALSSAGKRTGEPVVRAGHRGRVAVADLSNLLGWIAGGVPALALLLRYVPGRVTRMRALLAARRVLGTTQDEPHRRLLAMRAAFGLPFGTLLRYTRDPMGDLEAGRLDPLLRALGDEYGLRPPGGAVSGPLAPSTAGR
ncbi:MAG: hypothetical protein JWM98_3075 [Thermoleophilia bacterium]|nr:hypothetical protein [Thermoleophilia bacterium]